MIIAIDPGPAQSAYLTWDSGKIWTAEIQANSIILDALRIDGPKADLWIEMVACYGMAVGKEVFETVLWIGRFWEAWEAATGSIPTLVYRREIKMHHCNSMKAKDSNIRQALIDKYGAPGTKKEPGLTYGLKKDLWQAFAIATYVSERNQA